MKHNLRFWFWSGFGLAAVRKISSILLKYPSFEGIFFHGQNKYKSRVSAHCSVHTKMLMDI
jgi:hypothetical protein